MGITLGVCLLGLLLALGVAMWLARRIVGPLGAVGHAARQIAAGDLATRVEAMPEAQGETALLIADFNSMADRLQSMAEDVSIWNAQIAHELRTPLTILQGRLQGAKDGVFPLDAALVDGLLKQVAALTRLVEDLRSVSLADSGRLELRLTSVDLAAEIEDMAPLLRAMIEPAGFALKLALEPGTVRADASRVRQAILALVDNARRHADPCTLTIATRLVAGERATITVADAGPGLSAGMEQAAFRQFVRGHTQRAEPALVWPSCAALPVRTAATCNTGAKRICPPSTSSSSPPPRKPTHTPDTRAHRAQSRPCATRPTPPCAVRLPRAISSGMIARTAGIHQIM
jgi:two-component system sensor histidine kinase AdeS